MKENFWTSMVMEGGKISHKRVIAVFISAIMGWGIIYALVKAVTDNGRYNLLIATGIFVLIMAGVTTIPQIVSLVRGTPAPKEDEPKKDTP